MSDVGTDALNQKIQSLLSSPDSLARIQSLMSSLGGGDMPFSLPDMAENAKPEPKKEAFDEPHAAPVSSSPLLDPSLLTKIAPLLGSLNKEDSDTRLLRALRPYLHGDREKRLDDAIRMMQIARLAPLLQGSGKGGESHG